jgi:tight adherence protein B
VLIKAVLIAASFTLIVLLAVALLVTRARRRQVEQRLNLVGRSAQEVKNAVSADRMRAGVTAKVWRLLLVRADCPWKFETSLATLGLGAAGAFAGTWLLLSKTFASPLPLTMLVAAIAGYSLPRFLLIRERKRLEKAFTANFPDTIDMVSRMLRAGLPATAAFHTAGEDAPFPVNAVFKMLAGQMRIGIPAAEALKLASRQIQLPDFQFFAVAIVLQQSSGGNLVSTLEMLAQTMRKRQAIVMKARAVTAEVRFSAYILGCLPVFTAAVLLVLSPDYMSPLFNDARGRIILGFAFGGLLLSAITMRQMMRSVESV